MLSKAKIKYIQRLAQKKQRYREGVFVVEGEKMVAELLQQQQHTIRALFGTAEWLDTQNTTPYSTITTIVTTQELRQLSLLTTPNKALAVVEMPNYTPFNNNIQTTLLLALENIQDPGNMGTILRIADWFGLPGLFCSKGCVDVYNPKVVQASMGSVTRVPVYYGDLVERLDQYPNLPVYGAVLGGKNVYQAPLERPAFLLIGNEGKGLSAALQERLTQRLTIPKQGQAESLNAAVATGIFCALFARLG